MIDLETAKAACALVRTGLQRGTAYLVAPGWAATCAHVVAGVEKVVLDFPSHPSARCTVTRRDEGADCAILEVHSELPGITPLLIAAERPATDDRCWAFGFPAFAAKDGKRIAGEIRDPWGMAGGHPTIDIYSDDAGAGQGEPLGGFSGSPVVVGGVVVGHLRDVMRQDGVAALGQIGACPAERVLALLPELSRHDIAQRLLAHRSTQFPSATPIFNFIAAYLGSAQQPEPFGGRSEELRSLDAWCDDATAPPYLLLAAPAGQGKSALLVRWIEGKRAKLGASVTTETHLVLVPISVAFGTNGGHTAIQALATRLCAAQRVAPPLGADASLDAWRDLVSRMLSSEPPAGARIIVVLDGIDEAMGWEVGPGLFPATPSKSIRVVLSARDMAHRSGQQWLAHLGWTDPARGRLKTLDSLDPVGVREVVRSVKVPGAQGEAEDAVVKQLVRLSQGDPLVLNLYVKHLANREPTEVAIRLEDLPSIAPGLDGYFDRWWDDQSKLSGGSPLAGKTTRFTFNLLATAVAPLERRELVGLLRRFQPEIDGDTFDSALAPLARFVTHDLADDTYAFSHPRFALHRLLRLKRDGDDLAYEKRFLEWGNDVVRRAATGERVASSRYIVRHYLAHLQRSNACPADYLPLLDAAWEAAWSLTFPQNFGGHDAVVQAVWRILADSDREAVSAGRQAEYTGQQIRCALRLAAHAAATRSIPEGMVAALLSFGIWSGRTVLDYALSQEWPWNRAQVLASALPYLEGRSLIEAEAIVLELPEDVEDAAAVAMAALCTRHFRLGDRERATKLAREAVYPISKALTAMALARADCGEQRHVWLTGAFSIFSDLGWGQRGEMVRKFEHEYSTAGGEVDANKPTIEDRTRLELLSEVQRAIEEEYGTADQGALAQDVRCQALKYLLPFLTEGQRKAYLRAFFRAIRDSAQRLFAAETFWEIGSFVTEDLTVDAMSAIACLKSRSDAAGATLALWHALTSEQRLAETHGVLSASAEAARLSSIDKRGEFFRLFAQRGFTNEALQCIAAQSSDDWFAETLVGAIAPFLTCEQTYAGLALCEKMRPGVSERAKRSLLGYLASFDRKSSIDALRLANHFDLISEVWIAATMTRIGLDAQLHRASSGSALLDLTGIADPAFRLSALRIAAAQLVPQAGSQVAVAIDSFGNDFLALEALSFLANVVAEEDMFCLKLLETVERIALKAPSINKTEQLVPFFRRAIQCGQGMRALDFASDVSGSYFSPPIIAAILAIADSKEADLAHRALPLLDSLEGDWEQMIAMAALARARGQTHVPERLRLRIDSLSRIELLACAREICQLLKQLPLDAQVAAFEIITSRFELSPSGYSDVSALKHLCTCATKPWLKKLAKNAKNANSSTSQNELRSAVAIRLAEIGAYADSLQVTKIIGIRAMKSMTLASIIPFLPEAKLREFWELNERGDGAERLHPWAALLQLVPRLPRSTVHSLVEMSLAGIVRSTAREVVVELWGATGAIGWTGGERALNDIAIVLRELQEAI